MTNTPNITTTGSASDTTTLAGTAMVQHERARSVHGKLSFAGVIRGEAIKLFSLRSIRWTIAVVLLLSWVIAVLLSTAFSASGFDQQGLARSVAAYIMQAATLGSFLTVLIVGVLGVLAATSEYSSGLILASLSAVPRRRLLILAKILVVGVLGFVMGMLCTFGGALIAALMVGSDALLALSVPALYWSLLGGGLYLATAGLFALGVGTLLRSSAAAISVVVTVYFVLPVILQILRSTGQEWVPLVAQWTPAELGLELMSDAFEVARFADQAIGVGYVPALGAMLVWVAAVLVPATILFTRRDAA